MSIEHRNERQINLGQFKRNGTDSVNVFGAVPSIYMCILVRAIDDLPATLQHQTHQSLCTIFARSDINPSRPGCDSSGRIQGKPLSKMECGVQSSDDYTEVEPC